MIHPIPSMLLPSSGEHPASNTRQRLTCIPRVPNILLFSMFAVAERYISETPSVDDGTLWIAGDFYFGQAKQLMCEYQSFMRCISWLT